MNEPLLPINPSIHVFSWNEPDKIKSDKDTKPRKQKQMRQFNIPDESLDDVINLLNGKTPFLSFNNLRLENNRLVVDGTYKDGDEIKIQRNVISIPYTTTTTY